MSQLLHCQTSHEKIVKNRYRLSNWSSNKISEKIISKTLKNHWMNPQKNTQKSGRNNHWTFYLFAFELPQPILYFKKYLLKCLKRYMCDFKKNLIPLCFAFDALSERKYSISRAHTQHAEAKITHKK